MNNKTLFRSNTDQIIGGVASGLGEYLDIDTWIVRIIFLALAIFGGSGALIYVILWIAIPERPLVINDTAKEEAANASTSTQSKPKEKMEKKKDQKNSGNMIAGVILIVLGALFLIQRYIPQIDFGDLWPVLLIVIGIILVVKANPQKTIKSEEKPKEDSKATFEDGAEDAFK